MRLPQGEPFRNHAATCHDCAAACELRHTGAGREAVRERCCDEGKPLLDALRCAIDEMAEDLESEWTEAARTAWLVARRDGRFGDHGMSIPREFLGGFMAGVYYGWTRSWEETT